MIRLFPRWQTVQVLAISGFISLGVLSFKYEQARTAFITLASGLAGGATALIDPTRENLTEHDTKVTTIRRNVK